uniref:ADP-ribosyltransferase exoenzyme domain protein n=1 Tax=Mimivirus LCMiAC01 TaxID=2506608 RepID=A0A481Z1L8_9VIRU|nr:MAG: ADP-ribosyltransferase exoenzyme domain protein [Mimivirus LCMiAC01]
MTYILYSKTYKTLKIIPTKEVMADIYYQRTILPKKKHIEEYLSKNKSDKISKFFKGKDINDAINEIKQAISKIDYKIPLYHESSKNIYIITRTKVYDSVVRRHYRFPTQQMYNMFKIKREKMKKDIKKIKKKPLKKTHLGEYVDFKIYYKKYTETFRVREYNKLGLMIKFLDSFDLDILYNTYISVFYHYANEVGKNITICLRPSFQPHLTHINPYYTRSELINMGLNMGIIKESNVYYDQDKVMKLCKQINENDIKAKTITDHQYHIIKNNKIGIVQYYSLQGSYFINNYLRQLVPYKYKNESLEKNILSVWKLINSAPAFDKSYILFRFISNDEHLNHLKIGEIYTSPSFISTTRDQFYKQEEYKFGFILIKIKIFSKVKGIALCIETISHFPKEQEIILAPRSMLKLIKKDNNVPYYHTDEIYKAKMTAKYEFEYVGKKKISSNDRPIYKSENDTVDFMEIKKEDSLTVHERIKYFVYKYAQPMYQFRSKIGNKIYTIVTEWYDSTSVYKKFYAATSSNGFLMYSIVNNYISFTIELGEDNEGPYMYINYYFRHSQSDKDISYTSDEFIHFISTVAYYFEIDKVIIYINYLSCDLKSTKQAGIQDDKSIFYGGNYCADFYAYFKYNKKKYSNIDSVILKPAFSYHQLDRLKKINPLQILSEYDRDDELYQIHKRTYKDIVPKEKDNIANFYVWLVEYHCRFVQTLVNKLDKIYSSELNPFLDINNYYILDIGSYLYNNNIIDHYPIFGKKSKIIGVSDIKKEMPKNVYRLKRKRLAI